MLRRIISLILAAVCLAVLASCTANNPTNPTDTEDGQQKTLVNPLIIVDEEGTELGKIDNRAGITVVQDGLFYSVFELKEYSYTGTAEYRYFNLKEKKDVYLGKLEDQGYETGFARTELNGKVYTLAVKGNPAGGSAVPLLLLAFDLSDKTMKQYTISEYGFPYAAMTVSNGKLIIINHETSKDKSEAVYEFDPVTETVKEVLTFNSSEDSLRSVCAAANGFYLLRLKIVAGGENEMFVDLYNDKYERLSEQNINDCLVNAITGVHGISGRQDAMNEIGMNVSRFFVSGNGCMIYENFGLSRVVVNLETSETIIAKDDNYSVSTGSGVPVIYRVDFDADSVSEPEIFSIENGELSQFVFTPDDGHKLIQIVTVSADGTVAILSSDAFPVQNGTGIIHFLHVQ